MKLSVIVPMLNEERAIVATLGAIRAGAPGAEVIVVDGGSGDRSVELARPLCAELLVVQPGRARQLNAGAEAASGDALVFVHADTRMPPGYGARIEEALATADVVGGGFGLRLDAPGFAYLLLGVLISTRSRLSRAVTGDQAIFVRRSVFEALGGFPAIEVCEDLEFARRLKRAGRIACIRDKVTTSARRWQRAGLARTVFTMWTVKLLFLLGVSPTTLKRMYRDVR